jgi:hypothetical protein
MSGVLAATAVREWRAIAARVTTSSASTSSPSSPSAHSGKTHTKQVETPPTEWREETLFVKTRVHHTNTTQQASKKHKQKAVVPLFSLLVTDLCGVWISEYSDADALLRVNAALNPDLAIGAPELLDTISGALEQSPESPLSPDFVDTKEDRRRGRPELRRGSEGGDQPHSVSFRCNKREGVYDSSSNNNRDDNKHERGADPACNTVLALSFDTRLGGGHGGRSNSGSGVAGTRAAVDSYPFSWTFHCDPLGVEKASQVGLPGGGHGHGHVAKPKPGDPTSPDAALALYAARFLRESFIRPLAVVACELSRQHATLLRVIEERDREYREQRARMVRMAARGEAVAAVPEMPEFSAAEFVDSALDDPEWQQTLTSVRAPFVDSAIVSRLHAAYNERHFGSATQQRALASEFEFFFDPAAEDDQHQPLSKAKGLASDGAAAADAYSSQSESESESHSDAGGGGYGSPSLLPGGGLEQAEGETQQFVVEANTQPMFQEADTQHMTQDPTPPSAHTRDRGANNASLKKRKSPESPQRNAPPPKASLSSSSSNKQHAAKAESARRAREEAEERRRKEREEKLHAQQAAQAKKASQKRKRAKFV